MSKYAFQNMKQLKAETEAGAITILTGLYAARASSHLTI